MSQLSRWHADDTDASQRGYSRIFFLTSGVKSAKISVPFAVRDWNTDDTDTTQHGLTQIFISPD
ncbi:hypothetical protein [Lacihabitans soyangensis]|uniref:hypothetical protein n=1 Tax=Lacihabitans soyangensis TaxID=869394 RepID=UPI0020CC4605|nr:hypothetical protein [Lacihabitans soyangensis]